MKPFACKCLFLLPVILFVDYLILVVFGVSSCFFDAGEAMYCNAHLPLALMLVGASLVFFMGIIARKNKKEMCETEESTS